MKHLKRHFTKYFAVICSVLILTCCDGCNQKLSVDPMELTFAANATDPQSVVVDTDAPGWDYATTDSWITGQQSSVLLSVSVQPNPATSARVGTITVTAGKAKAVSIIVKQDAKATLSTSQTALTFEAEDNVEKKVSITTNAPGGWSYASVPSWITCSKDNNQLVVKVERNTTSSQRSATINISAGSADIEKITVTQKAPTLSVLPSGPFAFSTSESQQTINVESNTSWTASSSATSWLSVSPVSGSHNGSVTVKATANTGSQRTGTVTFKAAGVTDRSVIVNQEGKPSLEVSKTSLSFGYSAQTGSFNIASNVSWTVSRGSASWITVSPASGSNNAEITVSVTANTGSARTGTITVTGGGFTRTISVAQSGPPPTTAEVRFRKTSNNAYTYEMAITTTSYAELAYYQFSNSTGTTSYYSIPPGNHIALINERGTIYLLTWNGSETYNFQANRRYTLEYDGADYWMRSDGAASAPEQSIMNSKASLQIIKSSTTISNYLQQKP